MINLPTNWKKSVHEVDSKDEDLGAELVFDLDVLEDVEHPVDHLLPHVRLELRLNKLEIIWNTRHIPES